MCIRDSLTPYNFEWLPFTTNLHIDMGIMLDPISVLMLVVISTVSLMVHIYSFGYMKGEKGFQRYYAFLSLFTMSMFCLLYTSCNIDADRAFGIIYRTSALHAEFLEKALTFTSYNHFYT